MAHAANLTWNEADREAQSAEEFEIDPYAAIRSSMSTEHADLPANEVSLILGRMPATLVLHQVLNSREMRKAALASLLGKAARRSVRFNGSDVSIPAYLKMVSRLCGEVAEQSEAGQPVLSSPQAPRVAAGTATPDPRPDGIDIYHGNDPIPSWSDIRDAGITFLIHRSGELNSQDRKFVDRYRDTRANGFIRGSFHYYRHKDNQAGEVQANDTVARVQRLGPGDLAPALDLEGDALASGSAEPNATVWRTELEAFLDTIETKLGRIPLMYTREGAWHGHLAKKTDFRAADFAHFGDYPLWVIHYDLPRFVTKTVTVQDKDGRDQSLQVRFDTDNRPERKDFDAGDLERQILQKSPRDVG